MLSEYSLVIWLVACGYKAQPRIVGLSGMLWGLLRNRARSSWGYMIARMMYEVGHEHRLQQMWEMMCAEWLEPGWPPATQGTSNGISLYLLPQPSADFFPLAWLRTMPTKRGVLGASNILACNVNHSFDVLALILAMTQIEDVRSRKQADF